MATIMTRVGPGSVMAASLPSRGSPDEPAGVDTCTADLELALAAITVATILRIGCNTLIPRRHPASPPSPERLLLRLADLPPPFTCPTWQNVLLLVAGRHPGAPGKRTVTAALRILGAAAGDRFPNLSWCAQQGCAVASRAVAGWLLCLLVDTFLRADAAW